jgi:hypothetical protein
MAVPNAVQAAAMPIDVSRKTAEQDRRSRKKMAWAIPQTGLNS